jgi:hypothetical protein
LRASWFALKAVCRGQFDFLSQGLIGHYNVDSWTGSRWLDLSGLGNHVTEIGGTSNVSVARPVRAPAYIYGAPTAWMRFPEAILPSADYTLFFIARYNGATKTRIFQGDSSNWLSGFNGHQAGVALHGSCGAIAQTIDQHGYDWVIGTDRSNSFRSNGVDRSLTSAVSCSVYDRLAINTGFNPVDTSDFAIQIVLVYNRKLTNPEIFRVEMWLTSLQPAFNPSNFQVRVCVEFFQIFSHSVPVIPSLTIIYRALLVSMTHRTLLPVAIPAPGPLERVLSDLLLAQPASAATAGS